MSHCVAVLLLAAKRVWREASDRLEERITGEATESAELASASEMHCPM